jgi:hypothetical protein
MVVRATVLMAIVMLIGSARADGPCAQTGEEVGAVVPGYCDCCGSFRRCVRDVVELAITSGRLPAQCRRQGRRNGRLTCRAIRTMGCPALHWYHACDGPIQCGQALYPAPPCGPNQTLGQSCATLSKRCNPPGETCSQLGCLPAPPQTCPISRRAYKRDIRYLGDADLDAFRAEVLALKLARYRYATDAAADPERLGFMIDDAPHTPAVAADAMHVDLYGYTSMIVAAVQAQAKEIDALQREVAGLRRTKPAKCSRPRPSSHR